MTVSVASLGEEYKMDLRTYLYTSMPQKGPLRSDSSRPLSPSSRSPVSMKSCPSFAFRLSPSVGTMDLCIYHIYNRRTLL